ncbi:hypothetical protein O6H91_02G107300 [Diphasiastrum complanatum]|uniref:Uncharacterized protein n=1 Tax=Diphasiastrum complanatum TaxID=34168 RepID=A0ACC2EJD8_DIPCM|nr:hypothetical protein O6H91_02G107300 [Diphasiastrum complanatum]
MTGFFDTHKEVRLRPDGHAAILAIGTANPPYCIEQSKFPDHLFNVTNCCEKIQLKHKCQRICDRSSINRRYFVLTEEALKSEPCLSSIVDASLEARLKILASEVPKLAKDAAVKSIYEWGRSSDAITHLVFGTTSGVDMPGADLKLAKLIGLQPTVKRIMLYQQGCHAGATVMRIAKDLAENNWGARVLAVCCEISAILFRAPHENYLGGLLASCLFGDGAAAMVIGAGPFLTVERPLFEIARAEETFLPESEDIIQGQLSETGLLFEVSKHVGSIISQHLEKILSKLLLHVEFPNYNDMFWAVHPGGVAILNQIERELKLDKGKLRASRDMLAAFGNMSSVSVLFVLNEIRNRSKRLSLRTSGEGHKSGIVMAFGPGLTVECLLLKSCIVKTY